MTTKDKAEIKKLMQDSLIEFWDHVYPTLATKADVIRIDDQINVISSDIKDIKRRLTDLETDTPTRAEFIQLKQKFSQNAS